jgi:hypothetical protein
MAAVGLELEHQGGGIIDRCRKVGVWVLEQKLPVLKVSVPELCLHHPCRTLEVGLSLGYLRGKSLRPGGLEPHPTGH